MIRGICHGYDKWDIIKWHYVSVALYSISYINTYTQNMLMASGTMNDDTWDT